MKKYLLTAYLLLVVLFPSGAQEQWKKEVDSLHKVLSAKKDTNTNPNILFALGEHYMSNNPDSAIFYFKAGGALSEKINSNHDRLSYLALMTSVYGYLGKNDSALKYCDAQLELSKKLNDEFYIAAAYSNLGSINIDLGKPEKSLEYYQMAIHIYEQKKPIDTKTLAYIYGNMVGIYNQLEQQDTAMRYAIKSLEYSKRAKNDIAIGLSLANFTMLLRKLNKFDTALVLSWQEYDIAKKYNNKSMQINALDGVCDAYLKSGKYKDVLSIAEKMESMAHETKEVDALAIALSYQAAYYFESKKFDKAIELSLNALKILDSENIHSNTEIELHNLLSQSYLASGNMKMFHYHNRISDSLQYTKFSDKILRYSQQLQAEYELNKKQTEINTLTNDKEIQQLKLKNRGITNIVLIVIVVGISLLAFLYYRNYKQKTKLLQAEYQLKQQRIQELEKEKQLLAIELVMQGQEEERKRMATDLHDGLGSILSATKYAFNSVKDNFTFSNDNMTAFDKSMMMLDKSIQELRRVAHNMMPEALVKFGLDSALRDFCSSMNQNGKTVFTYQSYNVVDEMIPKNIAAPIYRIIQELTNNILKHADAKTALIQLVLDNDNLSITVEDDGRGFDISTLKNQTGIGYSILQSRVTYLGGTIDIHSNEKSGTSVTIEIPRVTA